MAIYEQLTERQSSFIEPQTMDKPDVDAFFRPMNCWPILCKK